MDQTEKQQAEISELVDRAQRGDSRSVGRLFELLKDRVYRFFAHRTSSVEVAEDLTQTVFIEMIQALPRYRRQKGAKFTTWLFQMARFRLIDHYRKDGRTIPLDEAPEIRDDARQPVDTFDLARVETALKKLPEKYQTVLHLRFREDLDTDEIAGIIKTTSLNVRVIQYRALRALRKNIDEELKL